MGLLAENKPVQSSTVPFHFGRTINRFPLDGVDVGETKNVIIGVGTTCFNACGMQPALRLAMLNTSVGITWDRILLLDHRAELEQRVKRTAVCRQP